MRIVSILFLFQSYVLGSPLFAQAFKAYEQTIPGTEVTFKMVPIPSGSFIIGSPGGEAGRSKDEGPQKNVIVSAFWMGAKEVTFAEWDLFFKSLDLPQNKNIDGVSRPTPQYIDLTWGMGRNPQHPSNSMSQQAALMYCKWLYDKTGIFFRLPTEAEWEYACRAGNTATYPFGNDPSRLKEYGYFKDNSDNAFHETGELKPNAWGLYDILGNLSEWTLDGYVENGYERIKVKDPVSVPAKRYPRVARGGSFMDDAMELRCANRIPSNPSWNQRDPQMPKSKWWLTDAMFIGFRIVRPLQQPPKAEVEKFFEAYLK